MAAQLCPAIRADTEARCGHAADFAGEFGHRLLPAVLFGGSIQKAFSWKKSDKK